MAQLIERYRKRSRVLHWIHSGAFVLLFLTGLILFLPPLAFLAEDAWTRVIHRVAAVIFVVIPLIYLLTNWKASWREVGNAFVWGKEDLEWLKAAPRYYFLADEEKMPPQGSMNTGQRMWWFMTLIFGVLFVITGGIMWLAKASAASAVLQWSVFLHDVAFIATGAMLFVHIYLGVFHPLMKGAWDSMVNGKVSEEYAKAHHAKWFEEVAVKGAVKSGK